MTLHEFLTNEGAYVHFHFDEYVEDTGDGESGPMVSSFPAYDQYAGDSHNIFVEKGVVVHTELRDIRFEEWIDANFPTDLTI